MHDPSTMAFNIPDYAFRQRFPWFPELVTIWHRDPEKDGSDDSCGWSYPKLNKEQRRILDSVAWAESQRPWFQKLAAKENDDPVQCETLMRAVVNLICDVLKIKASWDDVCRWACELVHRPLDNFRGSLCHFPGYHTNFEKDSPNRRQQCALDLFSGVARHVLRHKRPWWKHPRWHIYHWSFQLHPLQSLRRRLFTKCERCGKRFRDEYPTSVHWHPSESRWFEWFRSERGLVHSKCYLEFVHGSQERSNQSVP